MNIKTQLICVNSFWIFLFVTLLGWSAVAGFLPPPAPSESATEISREFSDRQTRILVGMTLALAASVLLYAWGGAVFTQLKRIEGEHAPMSVAWLCANVGLSMAFIVPYYCWAAAAFRAGFDPNGVQRLNDLAWLFFIQFVWAPILQCCILAYLTFADRRPNRIYPRWFGFYNAWCAVALLPAGTIFLFKHGPLAWNGLLAFWLSIFIGFSWLIVITVMTTKAIRRQASEPPEPTIQESLRKRIDALEIAMSRAK